MEVRPGFKRTAFGEIPSDWDFRSICDEVDLLTGYPFPSAQYVDAGIRLLRGSNVKRGSTDWAEEITQYWPAITSEVAKYELQLGDLVIAMDGSLVGRSFARLKSNDLPAMLLQRVARVRSRTLDIGYLTAFVSSDWFARYVDSVKTVTAIPHISPSDIQGFSIPIPPTIEEQRTVASALSDVDALLSGLDRLIGKKRDLKQAAMQQLLTGQTRLPGFEGEWEVKKLGDLGSTFGGLTGKSKADFGEGQGHYVTFMNVVTNVVIDCSTFERVKVSPTESQNRLMKGDLLFNGSSETPEEVAMCAVLLTDVPDLFLNT